MAERILDDPQSEAFRYYFGHKERGRALIFNNQKFANGSERKASDEDVKHLSRVLNELLGFDVTLYNNADSGEMLKAVEEFADMTYDDMDCFLMVILSHGGSNDEICCVKDRKAAALQDTTINLRNLTEPLGRCKSLENKPKLIFVQVCFFMVRFQIGFSGFFYSSKTTILQPWGRGGDHLPNVQPTHNSRNLWGTKLYIKLINSTLHYI